MVHMEGSVNLNCCSTLRIMVPHSRQRKHPMKSSGRTSLVRVTVPEQGDDRCARSGDAFDLHDTGC